VKLRNLPGFKIVRLSAQKRVEKGASVVAPTGPAAEAQDTTLQKARPDAKWWISPGHYYVDGLRCENDAWVPLAQQPYLADAEAQLPVEEVGERRGPWLLYLDAWERPLSWLDLPSLTDIPLGSTVDTAMRSQIVWQVKSVESKQGARSEQGGERAQLYPLPWNRRLPRLRVRVRPDAESEDPCRPALAGAWQGQENQLYRVEIHNGSPEEAAPLPRVPAKDGVSGRSTKAVAADAPATKRPAVTFKWSRENSSVAAKIEQINGASVTIVPGQLKAGGFHSGDRVELVRETDELSGQHGAMLIVDKVRGDSVTFEKSDVKLVRGDKLRRWDQKPCDGTVLVVEHEWVELEKGIEVRFEPAEVGEILEPDFLAQTDCRTGDHWHFTARTATASVDWPLEREEAFTMSLSQAAQLVDLAIPFAQPARVPIRTDGQAPVPKDDAQPAALPPHGVRHRYAVLAEASINPKGETVQMEVDDRRRIFRMCDASAVRSAPVAEPKPTKVPKEKEPPAPAKDPPAVLAEAPAPVHIENA
jgi:hypothetical protein